MFKSAVRLVVSSGMSCCWFLFGVQFIVFNFFPNPSAKCTYDETSFFKEGEGSIYYVAAYNSSVGRGLDTKLSTCGN